MSSNYISYQTEKHLLFTTCFNKDLSSQNILSRILKEHNLDNKLLTSVDQIHSDKVLVIDKSGNHGEADGLITSSKNNLILLIKTADCVPVFIYDNSVGNYGIVHAGWKGVKQKIHLKAIDKFIDLGSDINNLNFVMGPSIKSCCYEVGEEMIDYFGDSIKKNKGSLFLDLNQSISADLKNRGVEEDKIKIDNMCTYEHSSLHSYRRDKEKSGRMLSFIVIKK
tara:strand:- start:27 stop:695 length:669 start_codon:yes stop_codon:yes gene_type:complete